jgi:hypothetical protein
MNFPMFFYPLPFTQGWVFGLTSQPLQNELGGEVIMPQDDDLNNQIEALK